eukprot:1266034-Prymnesium_polylepis.1
MASRRFTGGSHKVHTKFTEGSRRVHGGFTEVLARLGGSAVPTAVSLRFHPLMPQISAALRAA